jgi:hypothetical protein
LRSSSNEYLQGSQILTVSRRKTRPSVSIERYDGIRESKNGNPEDFDIGSGVYNEVGLYGGLRDKASLSAAEGNWRYQYGSSSMIITSYLEQIA